MASTNISVARLLQLRVPIAWQEAVEVARLAGITAEGQRSTITLAGCLLDVDGSVALTPAAGHEPVLSVIQLLGAMLDGQSAPPELVTLVMLGDESPSGFSTPDQARPKGLSLEWFVRPNPEFEVARLAARGLAADAAQAGAASIAELRAQVTEHPSAPPPPQAKKPTPPWVRHAGVAAAVLLAAGGAWYAWTQWGSNVKSTLAEMDLVPAVFGSGSPPVGSASSPVPSSPSTASAHAPSATRSASRSASGSRATVAAPLAAPVEAHPPATPPSPDAPGADETDSSTPYVREEIVVYPVGGPVYSEADAGVSPPTMVYPRLPSGPRADTPPSSSYVELVIDEYGLVQSVRLRAIDATLNDRMIVSAVKAWQFEPARKDGVPVKYTMRLPVKP